jgi:hypothetical protein
VVESELGLWGYDELLKFVIYLGIKKPACTADVMCVRKPDIVHVRRTKKTPTDVRVGYRLILYFHGFGHVLIFDSWWMIISRKKKTSISNVITGSDLSLERRNLMQIQVGVRETKGHFEGALGGACPVAMRCSLVQW